MLVLMTAHTKNHCRLYISPDGTGAIDSWSSAHIITGQCGSNAGMIATGDDSVLIVTSGYRRIDAWRVKIDR